MRNVKIPGGTDGVGVKQGYAGISVLTTMEESLVGNQVVKGPVVKMVYELDKDERRALLEGGRVVLTMMGVQVVPHRLEVQSV